MHWLAIILISVLVGALLFALGYLFFNIVGIKTESIFSASFATSVLFVGVASLVSPLTGWSLWVLILEFVVIFALLFLFRRMRQRKRILHQERKLQQNRDLRQERDLKQNQNAKHASTHVVKGNTECSASSAGHSEKHSTKYSARHATKPNAKPSIKSDVRSSFTKPVIEYFSSRARVLYFLLGLILCLGFLFVTFFLSGTSPSDVMKIYDAPFHMSVIRHICETSNASPVGAGAVAGNATSTYPDICHALSALLVPFFGGLDGSLQGGGIQSSIWVTEIMFVGLIFPVSTFELTRKLTQKKNPGFLFTAVSMFLPVALPYSPLYMFTYGPLYENAIACSMLPAYLVLLVQLISKISSKAITVKRGLVLSVLIVVVAGLCHPNICFILGIFLLPYVVIKCPSAKSKTIAIFSAVAAWCLLYFCPVFKRTVNCNDRVTSAIATAEGIFEHLNLDYSVFSHNEFLAFGIFVLFLAIVVLLTVWFSKKSRGGWYVFGIGFILTLSAITLFPETSFARFMTGFWYLDAMRFGFSLSVAFTPFLFLILDSRLWGKLLSRLKAHEKAYRSVCGCAIFVLIALMIGVACIRANSYASKFNSTITSTDESKFARFDDKDVQMFKEIKAITGDDGVINNFNDSSIWAYMICGVNTSAKANVASYMSETDRDLVEVTANLSTLGDGSDYSKQLKEKAMRLNYRYVLQIDDRPHLIADFNDRGNWVLNNLGEVSVVNDSTAGYLLVGNWNVTLWNYKLYAIEF